MAQQKMEKQMNASTGNVENKDIDFHKNDLAIVGMSCRLPGKVNSPKDFIEFLLAGGDGIMPVPGDRWDSRAYFDEDKSKTNKMYVDQGGFIEDIDQFDPQFFGISPKEAPNIDPQHRWLLELTYEAFENAGLKISDYKGSNTAVYMGQFMHDYEQILLDSSAHKWMNSSSATGPSMTLTAARISYTFDFNGPSVALDTACSSSLVALDMACKAILNGDSELAVAGGVNILLRPELTMSICKASMLSPDCRCKSFDASANGYVRSEGAGIVLLKRCVDAVRDGDDILAVVKATGVNQDGQTNGITVPNGEAQKKLLKQSLKRANINASDIQYAEAHGTGTAVGDPIEVNALGDVLGRRAPSQGQCVIGSVKSNIGHSEATAGVAGMIKTILAMNEGVIPRNIHYHNTNPGIDLDALNVRIADTNIPWEKKGEKPRRAIVNSFGFGGTNSNVVLQEAPEKEHIINTHISPIHGGYMLLPVSSKTKEGLIDQANKLIDFLCDLETETEEQTLRDICYTATLRREHFKHRMVASGKNRNELIESLENFVAGKPPTTYRKGEAAATENKKPCFIFSGMGSQWPAMAKSLYENEPVFKCEFDKCSDALKVYSGWSLVEKVFQTDDSEIINQTEIAQPGIFSVQVGLVELLRTWGVEAEAALGHSAGEVGAAYAAGALSFSDAIKVVYHRSQQQARTEGMGKMLAVGISLENVKPLIQEMEDKVSIAAINSEEAITLSGDAQALERIAKILEEKDIFARFLKVGVPYHSPVMDQLKAPLQAELEGIESLEPTLKLYSSVSTHLTKAGDWGAPYWPENVREPVLFQAAIENILNDGYDFFIEIAPHPVLSSSIKKISADAKVFSTLVRDNDDHLMAMQTLSAMHVEGIPLNWNALYPAGGNLVSLPNYAWQHNAYWRESEEAKQARIKNINRVSGTFEPIHPLLGGEVDSHMLVWQNSDVQDMTYIKGHRVDEDVVYPGAAYVEGALNAVHGHTGEQSVFIRNIEFLRPLILGNQSVTVETFLNPDNQHFTINAKDSATKSWVVYSQGQYTTEKVNRIKNSIDKDVLISHLPEQMDKEAFYQHCHNLGLCYEGVFQSVERAWFSENESLVSVDLPITPDTQLEGYIMHPAMLDGAFQSLFPTINKGYLPTKIAEINLHKPIVGKVYCHLVTHLKTDTDIVGDLTLFDESGDVLVELVGVELKSRKTNVKQEDETLSYHFEWNCVELDNWLGEEKMASGHWVVISERNNLSEGIIPLLIEQGHTVESVELVQLNVFLESLQENTYLKEQCNGVIYLAGLDSASISEDAHSADDIVTRCMESTEIPVRLIQALDKVSWNKTLKLFFATNSVFQIDEQDGLPQPIQGGLWGFGRVLASEHPEYRITIADFSGEINETMYRAFARILLSKTYEQEVAVRESGTYVHRLARLPEKVLVSYPLVPLASSENIAYTIHREETSNSIIYTESSVDTLADHEVEVALNLAETVKDVSTESDSQGNQSAFAFVGQVKKLGDAVTHLSIGDTVFGLSHGPLVSNIVVNTHSVVTKPTDMKDEAAVALPNRVASGFLAFNALSSLSEKDIILINNASDMLGAVVFEFAKNKGLITLATGSGPEQCEQLRQQGFDRVFDVSENTVASDIQAALNEQGRAPQLNAIIHLNGGGKLSRLLALLVDYGACIDFSETTDASSEFDKIRNRNIAYQAMNLPQFASNQEKKYGELLSVLCDNASLGQYNIESYPSVESQIFNFNALNPQVLPKDDRSLVRSDGTYIVSGGLGGLGLIMLDWLAERGAGSVVLLGRRKPSEEALQKIRLAESKGVEVLVKQVDVSKFQEMADLMSDLDQSDKTIRGVFHSAGVIDDGVITQQTPEKFERVLSPKIKGAWNFHLFTLQLSLDFFVCFSSIASIVGWVAQCNYAFANTFLDTLSHYRLAMGKPATTINWGPWAKAGMAANMDERDIKRMDDAGMFALQRDEALAAMSSAMPYKVPQVGIFNQDWPLFFKQYLDPSSKTVFSHYLDENTEADQVDFIKLLASCSDAESKTLLVDKVKQLLAGVLGLDDHTNIDADSSVYDYGLNSLMALEFTTRLQGTIQTKVSSTLILKYSTVNALVNFIQDVVLSAPKEEEKKPDVPSTPIEKMESKEDTVADENEVEVEW